MEFIAPEFIFIVPYRDRDAQLEIFLSHMSNILEDLNCEVYFAHQKDKRFFNRGGMKNIGFLHAKEKYPNHYKNITFIFHDIDTLLAKKGNPFKFSKSSPFIENIPPKARLKPIICFTLPFTV